MSQLVINQSAGQRVFSAGGMSNIIFGGFLACNPVLSLVSKTFHQANLSALVLEGDKITLRDRATKEKALEFEGDSLGVQNERMAQLLTEVTQRVEEDQGSVRIGALWGRVREIYDRLMHEENPEVRGPQVYQFMTHLEAFNRDFARIAEPGGLKHLEELVMKDRLARRFNQGAAERGLDPHDVRQVLGCFSALYASQNASSLRANSLHQSLPKPPTCSAQDFEKLEKLVFAIEWHAQDMGLKDLWDHLRAQVIGPDIHFPYLIRDWMNDPANAVALAQVNILRVIQPSTVSQIPREIGKLTGLRELLWGNDRRIDDYDPEDLLYSVSSLPDEFIQLQNLERLTLRGNRFPEIPAVLERLPALRNLNLSGHQLPIRAFPDALERQLNSGFLDLVMDLGDCEVRQCARIVYWLSLLLPENWRSAPVHPQVGYGLRAGQLSEIPFRVWFRNYFSIPNMPLALAFLLIERFGQGPIQALLTVPLFLLSLPLLAIDCFIHLGIEPFITLARDALGYSRMVHIELPDDVPAVEA